jgi:S1-C subfamily serine protease
MSTEHDDQQRDQHAVGGVGPVPQPPAPPFAPPALSPVGAADPAEPAVPSALARPSRRVLAGSVAGALVVGALGGAGVTALVGGGQSAQAAGSSSGSQVVGPGSGSAPGQGGASSGESGWGGQAPAGAPDGAGPGSDGDGSGSTSGSGSGSTSGSGTGSSSGTATGTSTALEQTTATSSEATGVVVVEAIVDGGRAEAAGTGIVLTSDGEVLTNAHVVEGATTIRVVDTSTGTAYTATVTGESTTHDVAVLQLAGASGLATATLDEDDDLAVGDDVTAVGNSEGTGVLRAADGTVAALDQTITTAPEYGETSETLTGVIAVDADVVSGDSGGALLDADGEVVGLTTAATSGTADVEGYAIDIDDALAVVHAILGSATAVDDTAYVVLPDGELVTLASRYGG